eukprot:258221-Pyramimonas_sp.AAC.1
MASKLLRFRILLGSRARCQGFYRRMAPQRVRGADRRDAVLLELVRPQQGLQIPGLLLGAFGP